MRSIYSAPAPRQFTTVWERGLQLLKAIPRILLHFLRCKIKLDFIVQCGINALDPVSTGTWMPFLVPLSGREEGAMVKNFEDLQQVGKENVDIALKSMGACRRAPRRSSSR